jgi:predicted 2-oxoglutarate/Fe(II)-dependent dioxygenase YbiX
LDPNDLVITIPGFLTPDECQLYIREGEARGFRFAPITTHDGPVSAPDVRNNERVMFDDPAMAADLWDRLRPYVPPTLEGWSAAGLNERFRFYRYHPGQRFAPHYDGSFTRHAAERSFLTFMLYLNDTFAGGHTRFFNAYEDTRFAIKPLEGAALLFVHEQLHEGAAVTRGTKYVLRSDVMYRKP